MKRAIIVVGVAGCSSLLGLDNTTFEFQDAMSDAPGACDGAPACTASTGRSACGQLFATGSAAGLIRAAAPTGTACSGTPAASGPCALTVFAQAASSYYARSGSNKTTGTVDDCGRFAVDDIPTSISDVVVVLRGSAYVETATLELGRGSAVGTDTGIAAYAVGSGDVTAWGSQLAGSGSAPTITGGALVVYDGAGAGEQIRVGGNPVGMQPNKPWGAYFTGSTVFGTLDPSLTATGSSSTALVVPSAGMAFTLGGARVGATCSSSSTVQTVTGVLMAITLTGC